MGHVKLRLPIFLTFSGLLVVHAVYAAVRGPTTSMVRPHPVVWKVVHGVLLVYVLFLVWLVFQDVSDARAFLKVCQPVAWTDAKPNRPGEQGIVASACAAVPQLVLSRFSIPQVQGRL